MKLQVQPGVSPGVLKILAILFGIIAIICIIISFIFFDDVSKTGLLLVGFGLLCAVLTSNLLKAIEEFQNINQFLATLPDDSVNPDYYTFD